MDNYELWFFVEGTNTYYNVIIPKDKCVAHLKEAIQQQSRGLCDGVDVMMLDLLKVNMPLSPNEFGRLQAPDDAEKMEPLQRIEQLWPDQPAKYYLHVCVRIPGPGRAVSAGLWRESYQHLHDILWGKKFHVLNSAPFGDEGELEYLDAEEIDRLKLLDLEFCEKVLLFRREYITAYESLSLGSPTNKEPSVVVIGQPGIGKSIFLFYILLHRLSNRLPTALQLANTFVLFRASGAYLYSGDDRSVDIPRGTLALTPAHVKVKIPCDAFLFAERRRYARIVQVASAYQAGWKKWHEQFEADLFVMNYFSADEIKVLATIRGLQVDDLLRIYNTWGPDTRNCVWFPQHPVAEHRHKLGVDVAVKSFIRKFPQGELDRLQAFSVLFSVLPQDFSRAGRWIAVAEVASEHINDLILNATIEAETAEQISFFSSLRTHPWFKSATTRILKAFVLTWLSAHPASTSISCTAAAASAPALKIPVCPKVRAIPFTGLTLLEDVKRRAFPFCFLPVSPTLPAVDAIIFDKKHLITIQVTVSPKQSVNSSALEKIWDGLPLATKRKHKWCHVFVTNDGGTAAELRRQPRENPPGIDICYYSAMFDVEQLGRIRGHLNDMGSSSA
ncbi:hypothetical protein EDB85DRAFT_342232 [Lactarius pseudohatsudake]|nr:hypothetical protein EDB85DRAFT_342232 [Lactarius pseudohatsudake]